MQDPLIDREQSAAECDVRLQPWSELVGLDALMLAVPHRELLAMPLGRRGFHRFPLKES